MASLDEIIDHVREDAGADFAFVLTRRGRLVTRNAPTDMPERGRSAIVHLAEELLVNRRAFAHTELPREWLVPFGGAAPVDVYVAAREEAIVCVVMATFRQQTRVGPAVAEGIRALDELLDQNDRRARRRGQKAKPSSPKAGSSKGRRSTGTHDGPSSLDFDDVSARQESLRRRGTAPFLEPYQPEVREEEPPPEIVVTEAKVGRMTMAAIEVDAEGPEIVYGFAPIGRATIAEIEMSVLPKGDPKSSIPDVRVSLASMPDLDPEPVVGTGRQTLPFTEPAAAAKRAFDARSTGQQERPVLVSSTPQRTVVVGKSAPNKGRRSRVDPEERVSRVEPIEEKAPPSHRDADTVPEMPIPSGLIDSKRLTPEQQEAQRKKIARSLARDSAIEAWHQALGEFAFDGSSRPQVVVDVEEDDDAPTHPRAPATAPKEPPPAPPRTPKPPREQPKRRG